MKSGKIFFLFSLLPLFVVSCIKEDLSNCYIAPELNLAFQYTGDGDTDIFSDKVEHVRLYIFKGDGTFVEEHELHKKQLSNYQGLRLNLPKGDYHIVCWGNTLEHSNVTDVGETRSYMDHRLLIDGYETDRDILTADSLYYGISKFSWQNKKSFIQVLPFTSAHIKMEVYVEGLDLSPYSSLLSYQILRVRELDGQYNFDMEKEGNQVSFYPTMQTDVTGKIAYTSFNTFRFDNNNSIAIDLHNEEEEIIYTLDLEEFMKKNGISVEDKNEITIPIYIKFTGPDVEVSVAEWNNMDTKPIF